MKRTDRTAKRVPEKAQGDAVLKKREPAYEMRSIALAEVREMCERLHGYGSAGNAAVYCFGVFEEQRLVAAYAWQPPPPGAARAVCPEAPYGVLALSRMVAVDRAERRLRHISRPLRRQMRTLIDRSRWPVLLTYSDQGQGHTGHVYKCSGWQATKEENRPFFVDSQGKRVSSYSNGKHGARVNVRLGGHTTIQRWEHWACTRGGAADWVAAGGWRRVLLPGRRWASGNQAYAYRRSEAP